MQSSSPREEGTRVKVVVEGISLDLPSHVAQGGLDPAAGSRTPFNWSYNYLALKVMPHSLWMNGQCYGSVRPGDQVRLELNGEVSVNGSKRVAEQSFPFESQDSASG